MGTSGTLALAGNLANRILPTTSNITAKLNLAEAFLESSLSTSSSVLIKTTPTSIGVVGKVAMQSAGDVKIIAYQIANQIVYNIMQVTSTSINVYQVVKTASNSSTPCLHCPLKVQEDSALCSLLSNLKVNYPSKITAIDKLCVVANLAAVASKINLMPITLGNQFLSDIDETCTNDKAICSHISNIDVSIIEAWEFMQVARPNLKYKKDWEVLLQLKSILSAAKANMLQKLGGTAMLKTIIEKNTTAPCNTCDNNNTKLIKLDDYLKYIDNFVANYMNGNYSGTVKVIGAQGALSGGIYQVNATAFVLRALAENPTYTSSVTGFEEKIETINDANETNKAFADIIEGNNKIIECKSWDLTGLAFQNFIAPATTIIGSVKQFNTYLSDDEKVKSMQNIEYWFDKLKLNGSTDTIPIKEKFKQMMIANNALTFKGNQIFNTIWANVELRGSLFPLKKNDNQVLEAKDDFISIIGLTENSFYDFIKVK